MIVKLIYVVAVSFVSVSCISSYERSVKEEKRKTYLVNSFFMKKFLRGGSVQDGAEIRDVYLSIFGGYDNRARFLEEREELIKKNGNKIYIPGDGGISVNETFILNSKKRFTLMFDDGKGDFYLVAEYLFEVDGWVLNRKNVKCGAPPSIF